MEELPNVILIFLRILPIAFKADPSCDDLSSTLCVGGLYAQRSIYSHFQGVLGMRGDTSLSSIFNHETKFAIF